MCFNKLELPDYQDQALFVEKFMKAIQECEPSIGRRSSNDASGAKEGKKEG